MDIAIVNDLPITGYDETAGIQFVWPIDVYIGKVESEEDFSSDSD